MSTKTYQERAETHPSPVAAKLLILMHKKESNLCLSADVNTTAELIELADILGPHICLLKTHMDILTDFSMENTIYPLKKLAAKHNFMIFEDRKFADIGNTVKMQYSSGTHRIAEWSDITNAHGIAGPGIITGLKQGAQESSSEPRGLLMIAELSSSGSLAYGEYTNQVLNMAKTDKQFVIGFIAQHDMGGRDEGFDWLIMTPGISLDEKGDSLGQQYKTVDQAILHGADVIIVGRGLFKNTDPKLQAHRYRKAGWDAYLRRVSSAS